MWKVWMIDDRFWYFDLSWWFLLYFFLCMVCKGRRNEKKNIWFLLLQPLKCEIDIKNIGIFINFGPCEVKHGRPHFFFFFFHFFAWFSSELWTVDGVYLVTTFIFLLFAFYLNFISRIQLMSSLKVFVNESF